MIIIVWIGCLLRKRARRRKLKRFRLKEYLVSPNVYTFKKLETEKGGDIESGTPS
jgi:hypothetical protein